MLRRIDAPGIQINEIDKSQYDSMPDYSIVGTTCLICGFADKGENYSIKWINTLQTLADTYGYPQTEEEKYFWNACAEVLNKGGICLAAKLPYANDALSTLPYVEYSISQLKDTKDSKLSDILDADSTLTSYIELSRNQDQSGYLEFRQFDQHLVDRSTVPTDKIRIVDITNSKYGTADVLLSAVDVHSKAVQKECLGIMPVLYTAQNAFFYQEQLPNISTYVEDQYAEELYKLYPYSTDLLSLDTILTYVNGQKKYVYNIQPKNFSIHLASDTDTWKFSRFLHEHLLTKDKLSIEVESKIEKIDKHLFEQYITKENINVDELNTTDNEMQYKCLSIFFKQLLNRTSLSDIFYISLKYSNYNSQTQQWIDYSQNMSRFFELTSLMKTDGSIYPLSTYTYNQKIGNDTNWLSVMYYGKQNTEYLENLFADGYCRRLATSDSGAAAEQKLLNGAIAFANAGEYLLSANTGLKIEATDKISNYTVVKDFASVKDINNPGKAFNLIADSYSQPLSSTTINDYTVSKDAAMLFPTLQHIDTGNFDKQQLKLVGLAVYYVEADPTTYGKLRFTLGESFVGSLDKNAKDQYGKSIYLDNIVNQQSKLVRLFSNIDQHEFQQNIPVIDDTANASETLNQETTVERLTATKHGFASFYSVQPQVATVLGQYSYRCKKNIQYYTSIMDALNKIYDKAQDKNKYSIDLIVDAGVSNIAQAWKLLNDNSDYNDKLKRMPLKNSNDSVLWKAVLQKYDLFCKNMRGDCMFIADGLRPFALENDEKVVRDTAIGNTLDNNVFSKLKFMAGLNTSYGAGYCDWFKGVDKWSGDILWIPPSIKASGIYIYTDAYFNRWDAPAGMSRGKVLEVVDCAFSPNQEEAGKLYVQCWNYACNYPIDGIILEGQKTFQRKKTAFDRVNVRRLFLYLEREVQRIARYFVYEGNTAWQRERFVDAIRPLFEEAKQRNGIIEYYIKCDDENNTPNVIDNNELRCSIAIKPVKTIEFILLNFVCTNQSATVSEEIVM